MAIKASEKAVLKREFTWEYDGDDCKIEYNANSVTSRKLDAIRELGDNEADTGLLQVLSDALISWEVQQDDGRMWPTVVDWPPDATDEQKAQPTMRDLPIAFCSAVMDAIGTDAQSRSGG